MTREEAVGVIKDFVAYGEHVNAFVYKGSTSIPIEALNMAIQALEQEPSEDLISRQDVIDGLDYEKEMLNRALDNIDIVGQEREKFAWGLGLVECFIEDIKELPSKEIINMKESDE